MSLHCLVDILASSHFRLNYNTNIRFCCFPSRLFIAIFAAILIIIDSHWLACRRIRRLHCRWPPARRWPSIQCNIFHSIYATLRPAPAPQLISVRGRPYGSDLLRLVGFSFSNYGRSVRFKASRQAVLMFIEDTALVMMFPSIDED